jgi:hypothetical protein
MEAMSTGVMRMIPPRPPDNLTGSERQVFGLLSQMNLGEGAVCLTSLNLSRHELQRWGEIDFVVVWKRGLLAIEVKGGTVTCEDGIWTFEDRYGNSYEKALSPIAQAQGGYSSMLSKFLRPGVGDRLLSRAASGFCALFPTTPLSSARHFIGGAEMPKELVGTKEDCRDQQALLAFLERTIAYWQRRAPSNTTPLKIDEVAAIVKALRPSFDRVAPLSISLARVRDEQLELTEDQYMMLDLSVDSPRIMCEGGAGTGKTFLAIESLRREADNNPIMVLGTQHLAEHLRHENVPSPQRIVSFHELLAGQLEGKTYSTLIVDEGQQLTNEKALSALAAILDMPFAEARWRWFSDRNHQVTKLSRFENGAYEALRSMASFAPRLRHNCRNTPKIVTATEFVTGLKVGETKVRGVGPDVVYSQASTADDRVQDAAAQIKRWLSDDEVRPADIVLLSSLDVERSSIPRIAAASGQRYEPWRPAASRNRGEALGAATIEQFRGLEAPFVVLCDIAGQLESLVPMLYLGMTRANFGLFVSCDEQVRLDILSKRVSELKLER